MLLLGVHSGGHDSAAAVVKDGEVLFAIEEERLSRKKHDGSFPRLAIAAGLRSIGATAADLDAVCVSFDPMESVREKFLRYTLENFPRANGLMLQEMEHVKKVLALEQRLREELGFAGELSFCKHHVAHLASAFYVSGFEESALFSIDGLGEMGTSASGFARGHTLDVYAEGNIEFPHSIGLLYSAVTDHLGFLHHCDEGKVMGLAAYGKPETYRELFADIVQLGPRGRYALNLDYLAFPFDRHAWVTPRFVEACGPARRKGEELSQRHMDIAAALQEATERVMLHATRYLKERSGSARLSMAGGVALNCVGNGRVLREAGFKEVFVQPAAYDAGTAVGAALWRYHQGPDARPAVPLANPYLGLGFSDAEVEERLRRRSVAFSRGDGARAQMVAALARGAIVGWFNGRMEFGPRALGNRSILTAPFPAEMKDILNARVKHREWFRPFAPVVRLEDVSKYFEANHPSPYMLFSHQVRKEYRTRLPAITHVDGSARVQTVTRESNPVLYDLITAFERLTGLGVLLNTSFNVMGQPIVNTPEDALECFMGTYMDLLVFNGEILVRAPDRGEAPKG